jgi:TRAP-type uncharacterized transport system fused permease subunit
MLFIGEVGVADIVLIVISSLIGIFAVSAALEGYLFDRMPWWQRVISVVGGLLLIYPGLWTDLIGFGLFGVVVAMQLILRKGKNAVAA